LRGLKRKVFKMPVFKMPNVSIRSLRLIVLVALSLASLSFGSAPALSHEFWIEPEKYQVNSDGTLRAGLRNGQMFKGARLPYFDNRIRRFETIQNGLSRPYVGRMGDMPALVLDDLQPGLLIALHETTPDLITYRTWEKFARFAANQGFGDVEAEHSQRGLPESGFVERYSRHAKLLVSVDHGKGTDRAFGLETEFVALKNPYTLNTKPASMPATVTVPVQLLYQGAPRVLAQVEIFERAPDGTVQSSLAKTDATGLLQVPVRAQHSYLLNAVVLRPVEGDAKVVWETLWASMVFALP
jgi:Domain of unknown function (DUF4198)